MFAFENLEIWQKARLFAGSVYGAVEQFPKSEQFALSQQLRKAAVSIAANIAEGKSRSSTKEFSRYIEIAYGSLCEVIAELFIAFDRGYLSKEQSSALYLEAETLGKMLSRFRASLDSTWIKNKHKNDVITN